MTKALPSVYSPQRSWRLPIHMPCSPFLQAFTCLIPRSLGHGVSVSLAVLGSGQGTTSWCIQMAADTEQRWVLLPPPSTGWS